MMSPCPATLNQAVRPGEAQTITVTLPVTPLATADGMELQTKDDTGGILKRYILSN